VEMTGYQTSPGYHQATGEWGTENAGVENAIHSYIFSASPPPLRQQPRAATVATTVATCTRWNRVCTSLPVESIHRLAEDDDHSKGTARLTLDPSPPLVAVGGGRRAGRERANHVISSTAAASCGAVYSSVFIAARPP